MKIAIKSFIALLSIICSLQAMNDNPHKRKTDEKDQISKHYKQTLFPIILPNYDDFSDSEVDLTEVMSTPLKMISTIEPHDDSDENIEELKESSSENKVEITPSLAETFECCCDTFESTFDELKIHVKKVHNKNCPSCKYKATTTTALFYHIFTHTGEKPFKCNHENCNFATTTTGKLKTHIQTHTGEKPFKCDYAGCDFATTQSGTLKTHKLTHTGQKPYKCDHEGCNYATTQSGHLKTHKLTHTGEKPYKCDYNGCDYAATKSGNLKRHKKRLHNKEK